MIIFISFIDYLERDVLTYADIINSVDLITNHELTLSISMGFSTSFY